MKVKNFQTFNEDIEFTKVESTPKVSKEFEEKTDVMAKLISVSPEYSNLLQMAKNIEVDAEWEEGYNELSNFQREFEEAFPLFIVPNNEYVNTGMKIPFYGRAKSSPMGNRHPVDISFFKYMIKKIQNPGHKFESFFNRLVNSIGQQKPVKVGNYKAEFDTESNQWFIRHINGLNDPYDAGRFGVIKVQPDGSLVYHYRPSVRFASDTEMQDFEVNSVEEALELVNKIEKNGYDSEINTKKRLDAEKALGDFIGRKGSFSPDKPRRF
jgi:hypothetical protein